MYLFLELEEELEHLFSISSCARVSANTHAPHVYPCACIRGGEKQYVWLPYEYSGLISVALLVETARKSRFHSHSLHQRRTLSVLHSLQFTRYFSLSRHSQKKKNWNVMRTLEMKKKKKKWTAKMIVSFQFISDKKMVLLGADVSFPVHSGHSKFFPPWQFYFSAPLSESVFIYLSFPAITRHQTRGGRDRMLKY